MLTGKGGQGFMTKKFEEKRQKGLEDITKLTAEEIIEYEITGDQGMGRTKDSTYQFYQFPFPMDQSIRSRVKVDSRKVHPQVGGGTAD